MDATLYRCTLCHGALRLENDHLECMSCGATFAIRCAAIPVFASLDVPAKEASIGVASRLFQSPILYKWLVQMKHRIAPDACLGIKDITNGKNLLNVGCGSSVEEAHLEYDINRVGRFAATDISESFVLAAHKQCSRSDAEFCVASAENLPYPDSSFDVVMLPFILHHLPFPLMRGLNEALRVSKRYIVVFDHIRSVDSMWWRTVQQVYWDIFDGGYQYLDENQWQVALTGLSIPRSIRTGALGRHVFKFIIEKPQQS